MVSGMELLVVFLSIVWCVSSRHIDGERTMPCTFGDHMLMDGEMAMIMPEKCMFVVCRDGMIVEERVGGMIDTGCCIGFDNLMVPSGYVTNHCMPVRCENSTWVREPSFNQCCGRCQLYSYSHFITFDSHHYDYHGMCNYTLVRQSEEFGAAAVFTEMDRKGECATHFSHTTFRNDLDTIINITQPSIFELDVNGDMVTIPEQGMHFIKSSAGSCSVLAFRHNHCLVLLGSSRLTLRYCPLTLDIWAPRLLSGSLAGLCGLFNYDRMDDFTTPSGDTLPLDRHPMDYPETWRADSQTMPMCLRDEVTSVCNGTKGNKCHAEPDMLQEYQQTCEDVLQHHISDEHNLQFYIASCVIDLCLAAQRDIIFDTSMLEFFTTILTNYDNITMRHVQDLRQTPPMDDPSTCSATGTTPIPVLQDHGHHH